MAPRLVHLVYVSRATDLVDESVLDGIRAQSSRNNPGLGVTGLLLHSRGR